MVRPPNRISFVRNRRKTKVGSWNTRGQTPPVIEVLHSSRTALLMHWSPDWVTSKHENLRATENIRQSVIQIHRMPQISTCRVGMNVAATWQTDKRTRFLWRTSDTQLLFVKAVITSLRSLEPYFELLFRRSYCFFQSEFSWFPEPSQRSMQKANWSMHHPHPEAYLNSTQRVGVTAIENTPVISLPNSGDGKGDIRRSG